MVLDVAVQVKDGQISSAFEGLNHSFAWDIGQSHTGTVAQLPRLERSQFCQEKLICELSLVHGPYYFEAYVSLPHAAIRGFRSNGFYAT